ncbi:MAG TPA: hypothetical protein VNH18_36200, partial [Bryobacteraceae bacterium]|nr:hypothetical protein [Bryobacteraceae bacterium]
MILAAVITVIFALTGRGASAQNYLTSTGSPNFSAPEPVELGFADTANGNLHLAIHLGSYAQRGSSKPEEVNLIYDSNIWSVNAYSQWVPSGGLSAGGGIAGGWNLSQQIQSRLLPSGTQLNCRQDLLWQDTNGTQHAFDLPSIPGYTGCASTASAYAADSSGFWMTQSTSNTSVYAPDGTLVYTYPWVQDSKGNYICAKDSNGNYLSGCGSNFYDTLGRNLVQSSVGPLSGTYTIATSEGTSVWQITEASIPLNTNFQKSGVAECLSANCGLQVIQSITLPDQSTYTFTYDCDSSTGKPACGSPSGQTYYYGELISVTLPTGATINYRYTMFKDAYNNNTRWLNQRNANNGDITTFTPSVLSTCSSSQVGCQQQNRVVTPTGSKIYMFTLNNGAFPVSIVSNDANGNIISTTTNTWDFSQSCVLLYCHGASYVRLLTQQTTVYGPAGALTKQTQYAYDTPQTGNVTSVKQWRYYPGASPSFPAVPDRATYTRYLTTGTNNINRPTQVTICNNSGSDTTNCPGGGTRVAQTLYSYDSYGTGGCPAFKLVSNTANHDDANFGTGYAARGNRTQIQRWISGTAYLSTNLCYDTTGQVIEEIDSAGNPTTYDYTDNFFIETGAASMSTYTPSAPTNALPKTVTTGGLTTTNGYYYGSDKQALTTDPNGETTYGYYFDPLDRWTQHVFPIGWEMQNYPSPTVSQYYSAVADASASVACTSCRHIQTTRDAWSRKVNEQLVNAPGGAAKLDTAYDSVGRIQTATHAYVNASDPSRAVETFA